MRCRRYPIAPPKLWRMPARKQATLMNAQFCLTATVCNTHPSMLEPRPSGSLLLLPHHGPPPGRLGTMHRFSDGAAFSDHGLNGINLPSRPAVG
jgi:hypothetical protein